VYGFTAARSVEGVQKAATPQTLIGVITKKYVGLYLLLKKVLPSSKPSGIYRRNAATVMMN